MCLLPFREQEAQSTRRETNMQGTDCIVRIISTNHVHKKGFLILRYVDARFTIYSKTLKISSDIWQDFNIKVNNTVIKTYSSTIFPNFVFDVVQGFARVLNIKKTTKTIGGLISRQTNRMNFFVSK